MFYGYLPAILEGLVLTLEVSALSLLIAGLFGLAGASAKLSGSRSARWCAEVYTTLIRGMPELVMRTDTLDASLLVPVSKSLNLRFLLRHERGRIKDWHYDGVAANPTPSTNQQTYLDAGPQDYKVTAVGAMLQLSW